MDDKNWFKIVKSALRSAPGSALPRLQLRRSAVKKARAESGASKEVLKGSYKHFLKAARAKGQLQLNGAIVSLVSSKTTQNKQGGSPVQQAGQVGAAVTTTKASSPATGFQKQQKEAKHQKKRHKPTAVPAGAALHNGTDEQQHQRKDLEHKQPKARDKRADRRAQRAATILSSLRTTEPEVKPARTRHGATAAAVVGSATASKGLAEPQKPAKKRKLSADEPEGTCAEPAVDTTAHSAPLSTNGRPSKKLKGAGATGNKHKQSRNGILHDGSRSQKRQKQTASRLEAAPERSVSAAGALVALGNHVDEAATTSRAPNTQTQPAARPNSKQRTANKTDRSTTWRDDRKRTDVKRGAYSSEEKQILRDAVTTFADAHGLSTTDFSWLFSTRSASHGAWKEIAAALPHRTHHSVHACGTRILHPDNYKGPWTPEDDGDLLALVEEKGKRWSALGPLLGRMPLACRDRYKEIQLGDRRNRGRWTQEETQQLAELVQEYLMRKQEAEAERKEAELSVTDLAGSGAAASPAAYSRIVLDDINWGFISQQLGTRSPVQCMEKWYSQLSPSMVQKGDWGAGDDRRLLRHLLASGATEEWEVDWACAVKNRTEQQTRRRWRLMLKCVPDYVDMEFFDVVVYLAKEYTPDLVGKYIPELAEAAQMQ